MTIASAPHSAPIAATLATWHTVVASKDLTELPSLLHAEATFRSPMASKHYMSDLQALGEQMGMRIGPLLGAFKTPS